MCALLSFLWKIVVKTFVGHFFFYFLSPHVIVFLLVIVIFGKFLFSFPSFQIQYVLIFLLHIVFIHFILQVCMFVMKFNFCNLFCILLFFLHLNSICSFLYFSKLVFAIHFSCSFGFICFIATNVIDVLICKCWW
jgi:hypothetical protein